MKRRTPMPRVPGAAQARLAGTRDLARRDFIVALGAAAAWPLAARAQQPVRIAKIGHIESGLPSSSPNLLAAFR